MTVQNAAFTRPADRRHLHGSRRRHRSASRPRAHRADPRARQPEEAADDHRRSRASRASGRRRGDRRQVERLQGDRQQDGQRPDQQRPAAHGRAERAARRRRPRRLHRHDQSGSDSGAHRRVGVRDRRRREYDARAECGRRERGPTGAEPVRRAADGRPPDGAERPRRQGQRSASARRTDRTRRAEPDARRRSVREQGALRSAAPHRRRQHRARHVRFSGPPLHDSARRHGAVRRDSTSSTRRSTSARERIIQAVTANVNVQGHAEESRRSC